MACTLELEEALMSEGWGAVAGVDEAGRGPLAGPVMAAAVILPRGFEHRFLDDSKKLREKLRVSLYEELTCDPRVVWASASASVEEIDEFNIWRATQMAAARALSALWSAADIALVDGRPMGGLPVPHRAVVKGDGLSLSIAAASVIAKVERDRLMADVALEYPEYGFEIHKGYGTRRHLEYLHRYGVTPIHRRSFRPVAERAVLA